MYRGTTPTISLTVDKLSEIDWKSIYLTIKQYNRTIEKTADEMQIDGNNITVTLTQDETLKLAAGFAVKLQLRVLTKGAVAYATQIITVPVEDILKDGEIT